MIKYVKLYKIKLNESKNNNKTNYNVMLIILC